MSWFFACKLQVKVLQEIALQSQHGVMFCSQTLFSSLTVAFQTNLQSLADFKSDLFSTNLKLLSHATRPEVRKTFHLLHLPHPLNEEQVTEALIGSSILNETYENKSKIIKQLSVHSVFKVCGQLSTHKDLSYLRFYLLSCDRCFHNNVNLKVYI